MMDSNEKVAWCIVSIILLIPLGFALSVYKAFVAIKIWAMYLPWARPSMTVAFGAMILISACSYQPGAVKRDEESSISKIWFGHISNWVAWTCILFGGWLLRKFLP